MKFRMLISGQLDDANAFQKLGERWTAYVKENEPGTVMYNWYVGESHFLNEDGYADDGALLAHLGNAQEQGFLDEYMAMVRVDGIQVIGDAGTEALEALADFSPVHLTMVGDL